MPPFSALHQHRCSAPSSLDIILEAVGSNFEQEVDCSSSPPSAAASNPCDPGGPSKMEPYIPGPWTKHEWHELVDCLADRNKAMHYVGQIGDNWRGASSSANRARHHSPPSKFNAVEGTQRIQLHIQDGSNGDEQHSFDIEPSAQLRTLFNDYAEKRGVSLRSLRFSYHGKSLFLSSIGNKSSNELNIRDQDMILVHDTRTNNETSASRPSKPNKKVKNHKGQSPHRAKRKRKKKQAKHGEPATSLDECKAQHSKRLSNLHEEAEPRLKEIRARLNSLGLERQPPKRRRSKEKKIPRASVELSGLPIPGVGGKAGKSYFLVQVGEVQHLYKTAKPSSAVRGPCGAPSTLDLHGHTREEALAKLDECLKVWVDTAMRGSYPFVISAKIVCGCGNQMIAETVEKWIKSTRNVGNAPGQMH